MTTKVLEFKLWKFGTQEKVIVSSLIICTYKRPSALAKIIHHLEKIPDIPDEILIVDGSQDKESYNTLAPIISKGLLKCNIIYLFAPTGLTIQRNAGIDISKGEIVHFLDDDCLPEPNYFKEIEAVFRENPNVAGVTGAILNEMGIAVSRKYKFRRFLGFFPRDGVPGRYYCNGSSVPKLIKGANFTENYEVDIASGASMSFRRSIIDEVGGFSEFFKGYSQGEDLEFSLRVRRISKIIMCRSAECNHYQAISSRPDPYKKGFMEIFNRYYIWRLHIRKRPLKCRYQFWGDVMFINIYALVLYLKSGLNSKSYNYFRGVLSGTVKSICSFNPVEVRRTTLFSIDLAK